MAYRREKTFIFFESLWK